MPARPASAASAAARAMRAAKSVIPPSWHHDRLVVIDGHNDVLSHLHEENAPDDALLREDAATITLPRARAGGFAAGLFAMLPPAPPWEDVKRTGGGYDIPLAPAV